ncbi:MAG: peptidoglycan editing factor PgeF [Candidatus Brocadia sp.]|nr:peptidoglycan editing factor PgeF [Candidatus Brocadia sp.]
MVSRYVIEKNINSLPLWFFPQLLKYREICHFVSARNGGFSNPPYESFNLGLHVGDDPEIVLKNRKRLTSVLGIPLSNFTIAQQVHGCNVKIITEDLRGRGAFNYDTAISSTDAMVTSTPNICLMVLQADCVPLIFFDMKKKVIGVAHAGWRGTVHVVAQNTVKVLLENFNCSPKDILVGIGPSIGPCCYEIGPETIVQIEKAFHNKKSYINNKTPDGKGCFNLWGANKTQLVQMGIPERNIEIAQICTYCNHKLFFSYRYQNKETGRFGAGIMLQKL